MNKDLMFSSNKDDWETPQAFFDELNKEFNFEYDVACNYKNNKCKHGNINSIADGECWIGSVFCNPPYSRGLQKKFIKKAWQEAQEGYENTIVMLLPARTDTIAFHKYIYNKAEIRFLKGRLKFEINGVPSKNAAPFPSMLVIYRNKEQE